MGTTQSLGDCWPVQSVEKFINLKHLWQTPGGVVKKFKKMNEKMSTLPF